jgi:mannose-6-phosphate isomerase-like protein (cupin superfamily)
MERRIKRSNVVGDHSSIIDYGCLLRWVQTVGGIMESIQMMHKMMVPIHYHKFAEKSWGFEYWFENNKNYCGKIIQVRQDEWSSYGAFHFHRIKDETFLILSGTLLLDILDLSNVFKSRVLNNEITDVEPEHPITVNRYYLKPYNYLRLKPGVLHRFSSLEKEAIFTETSTTHMEEDSYRIELPSPEDQLQFKVSHKHGLVNFPGKTDKFSYKYCLKKQRIIEES